MAIEVRRPPDEVEVERVQDEERMLGGDLVLWVTLLILSLPVLLLSLAQSPQTGGFLLMCVSGTVAGVSFAQVMLRLPYLTRRFVFSLIVVIVVAAIFMGISFLYNLTLPVPQAPQDVMFKAPTTNG